MVKAIRKKTKPRWLSYIIAYTSKACMRLLLRTCRVHVQGLENFTDAAAKSPCILALWHNRLAIVSEILNTFAPQFIYRAFISKSRDGDLLALLAQSYQGGRALRVPHNARHSALSQMIDHLKEKPEIILITPDGPRGPQNVVKPGIVLAAREASAKVILFSWEASRTWKLNTWDKMRIPKPFASIKVVFSTALTFPERENENLEKDSLILQRSLQSLENF